MKTPPPRDPFQYVLNLEASVHSLLSFAWTLTRPTNYLRQNIVFWYSEMSFVFLIISLFFVFFFLVILCYFVIINFNKKQCYYYHFIDWIFFSWKLLLFFHVRGCSGMFRNVPECSVFWLYGSKRGRLIDIRRLKGRGAYC